MRMTRNEIFITISIISFIAGLLVMRFSIILKDNWW
jgi:hypothetical protein